MRRPRLVLADEHALFLEGLQRILQPEYQILAMATDGEILVKAAKQNRPNIVITEVMLPVLDGITAIRHIKNKLPHTLGVFVTRVSEPKTLAEAIRIGASGYLSKNCSATELLGAMREIVNGKSYITPLITDDVFSAVRSGSFDVETLNINERQRQIVQLIVEGRALKEIAELLRISPKTVEFHKYRLMKSLSLRTTAQLIHFAITHGIASPSLG